MPARTPWWLLLLRLLLAAFLILAAAGPIWNPARGRRQPRAASDRARQRLCRRARLARAHEPCRRAHRGSGTRRTHGRARGDGRSPGAIEPAEPRRGAGAAALLQASAASAGPAGASRIRQAFPGGRRPTPTSSGSATGSPALTGKAFIEGLAPMAGGRRITVLKAERAPGPCACRRRECRRRAQCHVVRAEPNGRDSGTVRALDLKNLPLAECASPSTANATETDVAFDLPIEIRNAIARIEILGEGSAGAVTPSRRARQAPPRRPRLRRHRGSGAASPVAASITSSGRSAPFAEMREGRGARGAMR